MEPHICGALFIHIFLNQSPIQRLQQSKEMLKLVLVYFTFAQAIDLHRKSITSNGGK